MSNGYCRNLLLTFHNIVFLCTKLNQCLIQLLIRKQSPNSETSNKFDSFPLLSICVTRIKTSLLISVPLRCNLLPLGSHTRLICVSLIVANANDLLSETGTFPPALIAAAEPVCGISMSQAASVWKQPCCTVPADITFVCVWGRTLSFLCKCSYLKAFCLDILNGVIRKLNPQCFSSW